MTDKNSIHQGLDRVISILERARMTLEPRAALDDTIANGFTDVTQALDAMRQIRDAKADNASDMEQSQVYRDAPSQVDDAGSDLWDALGAALDCLETDALVDEGGAVEELRIAILRAMISINPDPGHTQ